MKRKFVLIAFGGKDILPSHQQSLQSEQMGNAQKATRLMIGMVKKGYKLMAARSRGPQLGNLFIQMEKSGLDRPIGDSSA